jgi:hypothetical protein
VPQASGFNLEAQDMNAQALADGHADALGADETVGF